MCLMSQAARITGIGEGISPLSGMPPVDAVLVNPRRALRIAHPQADTVAIGRNNIGDNRTETAPAEYRNNLLFCHAETPTPELRCLV